MQGADRKRDGTVPTGAAVAVAQVPRRAPSAASSAGSSTRFLDLRLCAVVQQALGDHPEPVARVLLVLPVRVEGVRGVPEAEHAGQGDEHLVACELEVLAVQGGTGVEGFAQRLEDDV